MGGNDYNAGLNDMDACLGLREETHLSPTIQTLKASLGIKSPFPVHQGRWKKWDITQHWLENQWSRLLVDEWTSFAKI